MNISSCDVSSKSFGVPLPSPILLHILLFGYPILFLIGTVGNILSFIVLHPFGTRVSGHIYLACLAVFDTLSLFFFVLSFWSLMILRPYLLENGYEIGVRTIDHYLITAIACEIRTYLTFTTRMLSVWTVVIMSMERFLLIIAPLRFYKFLRPKVAWITMGVACLLIGLINLPWVFSFTHVARPTCLNNANIQCKPTLLFHHYRLLEFVLLTVVPAIILIIANVKIALTLTERRHMWLGVQPTAAHGHILSKLIVRSRKPGKSTEDSSESLMTQVHREAHRHERQLTIRLFTVSLTFCILSLPSMVFVSIQVFAEYQGASYHLKGFLFNAFHISLFLFTVNMTINFIIYCLVGKTFRRAVRALLTCNWPVYRHLRNALISLSNPTTDHVNLHKSALVLQLGQHSDEINPRQSSFNHLIQTNVG